MARVLVVSFRFPPFQSIGALSVGKTVKYLRRMGHDVRVVTAGDQPLPASLPVEIEPDRIVTTRWLDPLRPVQLALGGRSRVERQGYVSTTRHRRLASKARDAYRNLLVPDTEIGWYPHAVRAACRATASFRPDVVYASGPPHTSLVVAARVSAKTGVPWVAGLRDLWSDNPYRQLGRWFVRADGALERRVLRTAAGLVVTTDEAKDLIARRYAAPVEVVMNGYDPEDVVERRHAAANDDRTLRVVYAGTLIRERRDPRPVFAATRALATEGLDVRVDLYGRDLGFLSDDGALTPSIHLHEPVPYEASVQLQRDADVLLLVQWQHDAERAICPGKLFEYAAARRPVLAIAPSGGVVARLVERYGLGYVASDPADVLTQLRRWAEQKRADGEIPDVAPAAPYELSREAQVAQLSRFLASFATG
jgi:hypothetical protein